MYSSGRMAWATRSSLTGDPEQNQLADQKRKLEAGSVRPGSRGARLIALSVYLERRNVHGKRVVTTVSTGLS